MPFAQMFDGLSFWAVLLFAVGIVLLVAEMFHPGFGAFGSTGVGLWLIGIVISARSLLHGLMLAGFLLFVGLGLFITFLVLGATGNLPKKLILRNSERPEAGYVGTADYSRFVGVVGVTMTMLRPAGIIRAGEETLDVVSGSALFIPKGVAVRIRSAEGNRLVVERAEE